MLRRRYPLFRTILLAFLSLAGLTACSREIEPTLQPTPSPVPVLEITYCDIDESDLCLEGFGEDDEGRLLFLFKSSDPSFARIEASIDGPDGEIPLECVQSENFPENIYCAGDVTFEGFPEGTNIRLNIRSLTGERLEARGVFIVEYTGIPAPDVVIGPTPTSSVLAVNSPTPEGPVIIVPTSYPNPTNYPNP